MEIKDITKFNENWSTYKVDDKIIFKISKSINRLRKIDIKEFVGCIKRRGILIKKGEEFDIKEIYLKHNGEIQVKIEINGKREKRTFAESDDFYKRFIKK